MSASRVRLPVLAAAAIVLGLALAGSGCGGKKYVMDLHGSLMYDRPAITAVRHTIADERGSGGAVEVRVTVAGDSGLQASFDITPDVAARLPMEETGAGEYQGSFVFPVDVLGGPFTVIGRLEHEQAGEVTLKDPVSITITLIDR